MTENRHYTENERAKLYIVCPSLRDLLAKHPNAKEIASKADMEYSNFMKACKLRKDVKLTTYAKCLNAFDQEVILLSVPKGTVSSIATSPKELGEYSYSITPEDFLKIVLKQYEIDKDRLKLHIGAFLSNLTADTEEAHLSIIDLLKTITQLL